MAHTNKLNVGDRVNYKDGSRTCTGVITKMYPGYKFKGEDGIIKVPAHAEILVDDLPEWWPYVGSRKFAPTLRTLSKEPTE